MTNGIALELTATLLNAYVVIELEEGKNLGEDEPKIENYSWFQIYLSPDLNLTFTNCLKNGKKLKLPAVFPCKINLNFVPERN